MSNEEIEALPCPFCFWKNIKVNQDIQKKGILKGSKYSFAWCGLCGAQGPVAFDIDDPDEVVYQKAIERWNERKRWDHIPQELK